MTHLSDFAANQPKQGWSQHTATCATDCATNHRGADPPFDETLAEKLARLEADNARLAALAKQNEKRAVDAEQNYAQAARDLEAAQAERNIVQGQLDDCSEAALDAEQHTVQNILVSLANLAEETLAVQRHILSTLKTNAESRNVVEIDSNGSAGRIKVKIRCVGETLEDAHATALEQFAQAMAEVEAGAVNGWQQTVEMLQAKRGTAA